MTQPRIGPIPADSVYIGLRELSLAIAQNTAYFKQQRRAQGEQQDAVIIRFGRYAAAGAWDAPKGESGPVIRQLSSGQQVGRGFLPGLRKQGASPPAVSRIHKCAAVSPLISNQPPGVSLTADFRKTIMLNKLFGLSLAGLCASILLGANCAYAASLGVSKEEFGKMPDGTSVEKGT